MRILNDLPCTRRTTMALLVAGASQSAFAQTAGPADSDWSFNATIIESCSCPMFCQCYFNTKPAAHEGHGATMKHFCRFNRAIRINKGASGSTNLAGMKFWMAGDIGADFSKDQM